MNRTVHTRFASFARTHSLRMLILLATLLLGSIAAMAQSTAFSYQGRLNDNSLPASGTYDFQFKLFDALTAGTQIGTTLSPTNVTVTSGAFTLTLDFGATAFSGADRWLEISVRLAGGNAFTTLAPRQRVTATPYALKSLNATSADKLSAACTGCVTDAQVAAVAGSKVTGTIPAAALPTDSGSYIQNKTTQQTNSNFNISGNGIIGGDLNAGRKIVVDSANAFDGNFSSNIGGLKFGSGNTGEGIGSTRTAGGNQNGLDFFTGYVPRLSITNAGNFGIGTTTPNNLLTVNGSASFGGTSANAGAEPIEVQGGGAGISYYDRTLGGGPRRWVTYANNGSFFFFNGTSGNVANMNVVGTLALNGCIAATNIACASDARLKEQITGLRYGLRQLMQLRPVSWQWKDRATPQLPMGLIAQEVEPVMPELVLHPNGASGTLGLNYMGLVPVMIKATQEQQAQIEQQQAQIQQQGQTVRELKAENDNLKTRLAALEQMMQQLKGQAENQQAKQQ